MLCMYNIDQPLWCRCDATSTLCRCDATSTLWYALKARLLVSSCIIRTNVVYNRSEHVITLISYMFCVLKEACRINLRHRNAAYAAMETEVGHGWGAETTGTPMQTSELRERSDLFHWLPWGFLYGCRVPAQAKRTNPPSMEGGQWQRAE